MVSRDTSIEAMMITVIIIFGVNIMVNLPSSGEEKSLFPGILGDMILKNNETGKQATANMIEYDDFHGEYNMDDKKEKTGFWQSRMTVVIFLVATLMVVWFNSQSHSIRSESDENISVGNGTHVSIGNGTNFQIENVVPTGNSTNVQMDIDTYSKNWIIMSFKVINENLECIAEASGKRNFADIERCGKFLEENSNISLRNINGYNNASSSMKTVLYEYEEALKDYNIGGIKIEIGAKNRNVLQMGDAIGYIQNGTAHVKLVEKDIVPR